MLFRSPLGSADAGGGLIGERGACGHGEGGADFASGQLCGSGMDRGAHGTHEPNTPGRGTAMCSRVSRLYEAVHSGSGPPGSRVGRTTALP